MEQDCCSAWEIVTSNAVENPQNSCQRAHQQGEDDCLGCVPQELQNILLIQNKIERSRAHDYVVYIFPFWRNIMCGRHKRLEADHIHVKEVELMHHCTMEYWAATSKVNRKYRRRRPRRHARISPCGHHSSIWAKHLSMVRKQRNLQILARRSTDWSHSAVTDAITRL